MPVPHKKKKKKKEEKTNQNKTEKGEIEKINSEATNASDNMIFDLTQITMFGRLWKPEYLSNSNLLKSKTELSKLKSNP